MSASRFGVLLHNLNRLLESRDDPLSDGSLLDGFVRTRDQRAFAILMKRYGPLVWGVCQRTAGNEQDAEDVFQATFLLLARKAATIRKGASVGSWLFGVAHRLVLRARVEAARRGRYEQLACKPEAAADSSGEAAWHELRAVLDEELARLPEKYRAPLLLCYLEGLTQEEAAQQLGWSRRSVKDRLQRGRRRLRSRLAQRGLVPSLVLAGAMLAGGTSPGAGFSILSQYTIRAAMPFALRQPAADAATARAVALAEGGMKTMFLSKFQTVLAGLLAVVLLGSVGLLTRAALHKPLPEASAPIPKSDEKPVDRLGDPLPPGAVARLGTVRFRTGGQGVQGLGFLPDGKTIVTALAWGQAVQFWEASTGKLLRELSTEPLSIRGFALAPDGKHFAVNGFLPEVGNQPAQGAVRVWEVASGKPVRTFDRAERDDGSLAFTPDGKMLISLGQSGLLRIEEIASGTELLRHQFPRDVGGGLAVSPDGSTLGVSTGANSSKLYVWKWQEAEEPRSIKIPERAGRVLAFSPDGARLAECGDVVDRVRIWDVASGRLLHKLRPSEAESHWQSAVVFSPDGKTLVTASHSNTAGAVHLWDATTGRYRSRLDTGTAAVGRFAFSPDSRLLASTGGDGRLRVWNLVSEKEVWSYDKAHRDSVSRMAITGNRVATASDDHTVRVWDAATAKQLRTFSHGYWVRAVAVSPDGKKLASSSLDDVVTLWDLDTGRKIYDLAGHGKLGGNRAVGFTPDGKHFLSWGDDLYLRKWDVATGKAVLEHALRPTGVKVPDEDAEPFEREMFFSLGEGAFAPDGKTFVLMAGNQLHVFEVATGKDLRQISNEGSHVIGLAISPDSKLLLASACGEPVQTKLTDGRIRHSSAKNHPVCLWELDTGKLVKQIFLPEGGAGPVAFSADGKLFATAYDKPERRVQLWDVRTGIEVHSIKGFRGTVRSLAFTSDGKRLISGMDDTTALVWALEAKR
jgi:RNA polymerase sigma factor (sigma-70 family)